MNCQLPPPPVPADADLSDFKFMPLEVARLRRSKAWLICKRKPELAFYMLNLWTASWHERPAGSLEDDDDVLADAAMCSADKWPKVRADAMRGWAKCCDGRLYHPVVAEKVLDSYHGKAVARWSKECDRIRKENHKRKENQQPPLDFPPKPDRKTMDVPPESGGIPPENALKEEGRDREGIGKGDSLSTAGAPPQPADDAAVSHFSKRTNLTARAHPILSDWSPSEDAKRLLAKSRPDLKPERIRERTDEFLRWCAEQNKHSHNFDATWLNFMVKTHAEAKASETYDQRRIREGREALARTPETMR